MCRSCLVLCEQEIISFVPWRLSSLDTHLQEGCKEDRGNYKPASLTSVLGKVMEVCHHMACTG